MMYEMACGTLTLSSYCPCMMTYSELLNMIAVLAIFAALAPLGNAFSCSPNCKWMGQPHADGSRGTFGSDEVKIS